MKVRGMYVAAAIAALMVFSFSEVARALEKPTPPKGYPKRSIEYVVRWGAGGAAGRYARHFAETIKKHLDLDFKVVNMPGAGGIVGLNAYMKKPADGYAILNTDSHLITATLLGKTKHTVDKLMHICQVQQDTAVLVARADDDRFPDFDAMVKYAKDNPGKFTISVASAGGLGDVILGKLEMLGGFTAKHVPYAKFGERVAVVLGGHADVVYEEAGDMLPYINDGKMKPLFVFANKRLDREPYTGTCSGDYGWDHDMAIWRGIAVKNGTPVPIARYLEQVFKYYHNTPEGIAHEKKYLLDLRPGYIGWDDNEKRIQKDMVEFEKVMKHIGLIK